VSDLSPTEAVKRRYWLALLLGEDRVRCLEASDDLSVLEAQLDEMKKFDTVVDPYEEEHPSDYLGIIEQRDGTVVVSPEIIL